MRNPDWERISRVHGHIVKTARAKKTLKKLRGPLKFPRPRHSYRVNGRFAKNPKRVD